MKTNKKYSAFQKTMIIIIPIVVLLLIAAIVMCAAFSFLPMSNSDFMNTGYITIIFSITSAVLAILGIVFAVVNKDMDDEQD